MHMVWEQAECILSDSTVNPDKKNNTDYKYTFWIEAFTETSSSYRDPGERWHFYLRVVAQCSSLCCTDKLSVFLSWTGCELLDKLCFSKLITKSVWGLSCRLDSGKCWEASHSSKIDNTRKRISLARRNHSLCPICNLWPQTLRTLWLT